MNRDPSPHPQFPTWFVAVVWIVTAAAVHILLFVGATWVGEKLGPRIWSPERESAEPIEVTMLYDDEQDPDAEGAAPDPDKLTPVPPKNEKVAQPPKPVPKTPVTPKKAPAEKKKTPVAKKGIEVKQNVEDENQKNENAELLAEHANKVKEQTRAEQTATDADLDKPEMGSTESPEDRLGQDEESPGNPDRAPLDGALGRQQGNEKTDRAKSELGDPVNDPNSRHERGTGASANPAANPDQQLPGQKAADASPERPTDPGAEPLTSPDGSWALRPGQDPQKAQPARKKRRKRLPPARRGGAYGDMFGLGGRQRTANGINLNLNFNNALDPTGKKALAELKRADGERRLSQHRKSWEGLGLKRWRNAIENYVAHVKVGNQTALNTAKSPFGGYLWKMHNRIHPVFAMGFLPTLDRLGDGHPMNQMARFARLEIVLNRKSGSVVKMGVVKTSGITAFDVGALESVHSAAPFGQPPAEIISHDGNVYLHWEFYRLPQRACSNHFAYPFILDSPEQPGAPTPKPGPRKTPRDKKQYGAAPTERRGPGSHPAHSHAHPREHHGNHPHNGYGGDLSSTESTHGDPS